MAERAAPIPTVIWIGKKSVEMKVVPMVMRGTQTVCQIDSASWNRIVL